MNNYTAKTRGQAVPLEWKLPILFKMVPKSQLADIKLRHKYAVGDAKSYDVFTRTLIELANERVYDTRTAKRGPNDMDVDNAEGRSREA